MSRRRKDGRAIRRAVPKTWDYRKSREARKINMLNAIPDERKRMICGRISDATGWSVDWLAGLDDRSLTRLAEKYVE